MSMSIIKTALFIFLGLIGLCLIIYLPRLICYFAPFKKQKHLVNLKRNKFLIMIPARNESSVIRGILNCLRNQDYPEDLFDVVLIVKSEDDPTIQIAKEYNYKTLVASEQHNKAEALDICWTKVNQTENSYDAFMVIDADCWLDKSCLREANNGLASGGDIITCKKMSKNYILRGKNSGSLSGMCNGTIWPLIDELGNRFKSDHGLYQMTISTGIVFLKSTLKKTGGFKFNKTMTEDMEMMFAAPLYNFKQYYCSYSVIYMDEAESFKTTTVRRNRWIKGYVDSKRLYSPLLKEKMTSPKQRLERYFLNGLYPVFWMYGIAVIFLAMSLIMAITLAWMKNDYAIYALYNALIAFGFIYVSFFLMTLFVLAIDFKKMKCPMYKRILVLFLNPFFEMGYFRVCIRALFGKEEDEWVPIERNASTQEK